MDIIRKDRPVGDTKINSISDNKDFNENEGIQWLRTKLLSLGDLIYTPKDNYQMETLYPAKAAYGNEFTSLSRGR